MRIMMFAAATILVFGCGGEEFTTETGNDTDAGAAGTVHTGGSGGAGSGGTSPTGGYGQGGYSAGTGGSAGFGKGGQAGFAVATGGTAGKSQGGSGGETGGFAGSSGGSLNTGGAAGTTGGNNSGGNTAGSGGSAGESGGSAGTGGDSGGNGGDTAGSAGDSGGGGNMAGSAGESGASGSAGSPLVCDTATVVFSDEMPCYKYGIYRAGSFLPSPESSQNDNSCETGVACNNPQDGDFDILWTPELNNQGKFTANKAPTKFSARCTNFTAANPPTLDQLKAVIIAPDGWFDPNVSSSGNAITLTSPTCGGSSVTYAMKY